MSRQVQRGGWGAGRGEYKLLHRQADGEPAEARMGFSGLDDELASFVEQARDCNADISLMDCHPDKARRSTFRWACSYKPVYGSVN